MNEKLKELAAIVLDEKFPISNWNHKVKIPVMKWAHIKILVREMMEEQKK